MCRSGRRGTVTVISLSPQRRSHATGPTEPVQPYGPSEQSLAVIDDGPAVWNAPTARCATAFPSSNQEALTSAMLPGNRMKSTNRPLRAHRVEKNQYSIRDPIDAQFGAAPACEGLFTFITGRLSPTPIDSREEEIPRQSARSFSGARSRVVLVSEQLWCHRPSVGRIVKMPTSLSIQTLLGDVVASTGHRYAAKDSAGNTTDTVKIIANPSGGYLGIYHTGTRLNLSTSTDLLNWVFRRTLDTQATQPTIYALPTGGFLTAAEYNNEAGSGGQLRFRHYANLSALLAGTANRDRTVPRSLSACNEGTPSIYSVSLTPDIDHSIIDVGFHYQRNCDLDRQARGRLTNFASWTAAADPGADALLTGAAAAQGRTVTGNIGDRDTAMFDNTRYTLHEVQYVKNDFGSWRIYLHNWQTGTAAYLPVTTHGGSTAFANPTFTSITSPSGKPAVLATLFVPSEGAAPGEAGQLVYYREYTSLPTPDTGLSATYYDNMDFTGSTLVRTDPRIDLDFGTRPPSTNMGADQFAVRWTGQVLADRAETYTFYTQTDDGARLWINGVQLVNDWTDHGIVENRGTISLIAGRKYALVMEYYDNSGAGLARLLWSSPSTPKAVVPADHLFQPTNGLTGNYFPGITLTGPARTRTDRSVNFNWGKGFGDPNVGTELFSVRWTGRVTPPTSETYRFYANTDDGARLWVNNVLIVDNWTDHGPTETSGTITLTKGVGYDIRMEYYQKAGSALAQLLWSSPSLPKQIIPAERLTPEPGPVTPPVT